MKIQDAAIVAAVVLSHRYISDRFLPDKAIDLVDEACAMLRTEIDSMPAELDELTRRVRRLEIEEAALAKEEDAASRQRLDEVRKELADLRAEADAMHAQWEAERQALRPSFLWHQLQVRGRHHRDRPDQQRDFQSNSGRAQIANLCPPLCGNSGSYPFLRRVACHGPSLLTEGRRWRKSKESR